MKYILFALAMSVHFSAVAQPIGICPDYPPVINLSGPEFYSDSQGSKVDPRKESELRQARQPVNDFLSYETQSVDGAPAWSKLKGLSPACADMLLEQWASAGAMSTTVDESGKYSREGGVDKGQFTRGMVMLTIKLEAQGHFAGFARVGLSRSRSIDVAGVKGNKACAAHSRDS